MQCASLLGDVTRFTGEPALDLGEAMKGLPQDDEGRLKNLVRAEDFAQAGFEVRFMDEDPEVLAAEADGGARFLVEPATFERWLEVAHTKSGCRRAEMVDGPGC